MIRNLVSISQEKRALTCQVDNKSLKFEMVTHSNIGNVNLHLFGFKKEKYSFRFFFCKFVQIRLILRYFVLILTNFSIEQILNSFRKNFSASALMTVLNGRYCFHNLIVFNIEFI